MLRPGTNCWRREHADRVAFLVDGAAYFEAFAEAALRARHSILIVGWDFNSRIALHHPAAQAAGCDEVGGFLNALAERSDELEIRILNWDFAVLYALEREMFPALRFGLFSHPRVHFELDGAHPLAASQHEKLVVIDDAIAFVGGLDFGAARWDEPSHLAFDPRRIDPWGKNYAPFHDVQMAVDGDAAKRLGELARDRWRRATGVELEAPSGAHDPWPESLQPDVTDVHVGISRTRPGFEDSPEVREVEALYLDSIARARRWIYVENQYFTSERICEAFCERLRERNGPEVAMVLPRECSGWLEEQTMGSARCSILATLQAADRYGRLRLLYPTVPSPGDCTVNVHSKLFIGDDDFVRIGSSNLSNRSMGLDSECDLAFEAGGEARIEAAIARFRSRLLGEHLGVEVETVERAVRQTGSLIAAVDTLRGGSRTLLELHPEPAVDVSIAQPLVVDPDRPLRAKSILQTLGRLWKSGVLGKIGATSLPA